MIKEIFVTIDKSPVTPVERPVVPKADPTSNNRCKYECLSVPNPCRTDPPYSLKDVILIIDVKRTKIDAVAKTT